MREKPYYSIRTGKNQGAIKYTLDVLRDLFFAAFNKLNNEAYFDMAFGKECVDAGLMPGKLGPDVRLAVLLHLRKPHLWPIGDNYKNYTEDDVFDLVEFLYDCCAKPVEGNFHNWSDCGWHYSTFDEAEGKREFIKCFNPILRDYGDGFEISSEGEVLSRVDQGMEALFEEELATEDSSIFEKFTRAQRKFRHFSATPEERREAVRELADILEYLRPQLKTVLTKQDESDLFNIANNFGIRHHNPGQKTDYDKDVWFSWIFYYYSATIHAAMRLLQKAAAND